MASCVLMLRQRLLGPVEPQQFGRTLDSNRSTADRRLIGMGDPVRSADRHHFTGQAPVDGDARLPQWITLLALDCRDAPPDGVAAPLPR